MISWCVLFLFFFSSRRRHTRCALVTGVQTCALPILRLVHWIGRIGCNARHVVGRRREIAGVIGLWIKVEGMLETLALRAHATDAPQIGRASCRERVCQYV